jgi:histidinol-phosphate phosphatase family protein
MIRLATSRGGGADPLVLLDKDGTLIEDLPYNVDPRRIRFAPGAREAVRIWADHGWRIAIVTNQSGVARGYFGLADLDAVARHLETEIRRLGAGWGGFYACPHLPDGVNEYAIDCDCRKPAAGSILRAAADNGVVPADCWFIGDTWMDMAAGHAAGCRTILVGREWRLGDTYPSEARPDHAVPDLATAARIAVAAPRRGHDAPVERPGAGTAAEGAILEVTP